MKAKHTVAVVGVDMGSTGNAAIREAVRLMATGAIERLHLLHVVDPTLVIDDKEMRAFETVEQILERAPIKLKTHALDTAYSAGLVVAAGHIHGHARVGNHAAALIQMCVDYDADLLIVGTHGRSGVERWLDGSVAEQVLRGAHCPVLVVRRKDYTNMPKTSLPDLPYAPGEEPATQHEHSVHAYESTTLSSWSANNEAPTGFRIV